MANLFLLDDEGVPGDDADALDGAVGRIQIDGLGWKTDEYVESGDRDAGELGELCFQLRHLVVGREAVDDLVTRLGFYPEYKARHDDDRPVTEDDGYASRGQVSGSPPIS